MMYPQMMMAASGQQPNSSNNMSGIPMDLMNPDLLAAQVPPHLWTIYRPLTIC